ncbi:MAG: VOC family protein [Candidatus Diapherotrites archaeon]|nr:VOC family protein [Candidatus Diapherotrites archaeon]
MNAPTIHPKTAIGHIHLTVSDLKRSLAFYRDILGFEVTQDLGSAVFLSAGGYHHHIGLNTWRAPDAQKPREGQIGLYHFAILLPTRQELAKVVKRLLDANYPIDGAGDHGVSESIYLHDPDGNGIELYADRAKKDWPVAKDGKIAMHTLPVDLDGLLKEAK